MVTKRPPSTSSRRTPKVTGGELAPTGRVATRSDAADSSLPAGRMPVLRVVPMPADVKLPSTELKALGEASAFWRELGTRVGADVLLSGIVDFRVEDKSGYKTEEYQSLYDGRTYYRQVFVETTGFTFEVTVLAFDGRTGAKLFQETFKDQKEKSRRAADEMVGLFENLFSLENQLLGLFVVREREANRYVFD